ncbi:MAG: hypothetical protein ABII80_00080 [bacterium]
MSREINFPRSQSLELLTGVISKPSIEQPISLVESGAGIAGLTEYRDNIEWSGIFHHVMLSTGIAHNLAVQLAESGHDINPDVVLQAGLNSHLGRRTWDEANLYPDLVENSEQKLSKTNEAIGLEILQEAAVESSIFQTVGALAHGVEVDPSWYQTLEYKVFSYVDHRISNQVFPYQERMGKLLINEFFPKDQINDQNKQAVNHLIQEIFSAVKENQPFTHYQTVLLAQILGATETSNRLPLDKFMGLIIEDAETELMLENAGINVANLDQTPQPRWERYLRRLFLMEAEKEAFEAKQDLNNKISQYQVTDGLTPNDISEMEKQAGFNPARWGTGAFEEIYANQHGKPLESRNNSSRELVGWARAINFFAYLENQKKFD